MKRILIPLLLGLTVLGVWAGSEGNPGGPFTAQVQAVGGKDSSSPAKLVPFAVNAAGAQQMTLGAGTVTSAPGATPSPSPFQVVNIQGSTSGIAVNVGGTAADNAVAVGNPVQAGGKAVTGSSYSPAYTAGDVTVLAVDKDSGGLLTHGRKLTRPNDAVSADPQQYTTASNFTIATADGTVFTLAAGEKGVIKNLDDVALAYKLGASASTSSLSGILYAGTAADDGKGGSVIIDDFVGVVSVAAMAGSPRFIAYKLSP